MTTLDTALGQLPEVRQQQLRYARAIESAVAQGGNLVAEAAVGTGKSLGYLVATLLSGKRVLIATHSLALQEQLRQGDIPTATGILNTQGKTFTWAILKGTGNYACHLKADKYAVDETLRAWVFNTQPGGHDLALVPPGVPAHEVEEIRTDMDECEGKRCPFLEDCASRLAKKAAAKADLVITNQALLMRAVGAPNVIDLATYGVVVIDEAHQLPEVARGAFSSSLTRHRLLKTYRHLRQNASDPESVERRIAQLRGIWRKVSDLSFAARGKGPKAEQGDRWAVPVDHTSEALSALAVLLEDTAEDLEQGAIWMDGESAREKAGRWLSELRATTGDMSRASKLGVLVWEVGSAKSHDEAWGPEGRLELCPIDVAPILASSFWNQGAPRGCSLCMGEREILVEGDWIPCTTCDGSGYVVSKTPISFVLTSATLAVGDGDTGEFTFGPYLDEVGMPDAGTALYAVGSPFNYAKQAVIYIGGGEAPGERRGKETRLWIDEIDYLVNVSRGRALVLFSSRKAMKDAFFERRHRYPSRWQEPDSDRMELIRWKRQTPNSVLYATKTFWEGISIEGDALGLVIIDKAPFPVPTDPVYAARVAKMGGSKAGFLRLAVPLAATGLRQGAGRLIRSKMDRGLVAILDGRLWGFGALAQSALRTLLPGAPIFPTFQRREMIQAWAATGSPIDLEAAGFPGLEISPGIAGVEAFLRDEAQNLQAQQGPSQPTPTQADPPQPKHMKRPGPEAHPVLHMIPPGEAMVDGAPLREVGLRIKTLLDQL